MARLDADETCRPDRLARQMEIFQREPDVAVVATAFRVVRPDGTEAVHTPEFTDETLFPRC